MIGLGPLRIDAVEFASQGNAILGIRDSGKTYTATKLAEGIFDAGIPFFAFDPIGVWRWMRVPGRGKGYPVVVAGGKLPDLPLTVDNVVDLTRQAMRAGVSVIFDLFDVNLSKADWRRIVTAAVRTMLHEPHGLRHVFLEEAAEFIPQRPIDFIVYAEIEKLARMGRNQGLGFTLINQRAQEVSKAILELCENVFLHRQRGRHAIDSLDKWLAATETKERARIKTSLPDMPRGRCWAWLGGDVPQPPLLIAVPEKNSRHPDARAVWGTNAPRVRPVDVGSFIARMTATHQPQLPPGSPVPRQPRKQKLEEDDVTKAEADALKHENEILKQQLAEARAGSASPVDNFVGNEVSPNANQLYEMIKARLVKEAPALLRVLAVKPEIEVSVERKVLNVDGSSLRGRISRLIAEGFFEGGKSQSNVRTELKRRGPEPNFGNLSREMDTLHRDGFLVRESDNTYHPVAGMVVREYAA